MVLLYVTVRRGQMARGMFRNECGQVRSSQALSVRLVVTHRRWTQAPCLRTVICSIWHNIGPAFLKKEIGQPIVDYLGNSPPGVGIDFLGSAATDVCPYQKLIDLFIK